MSEPSRPSPEDVRAAADTLTGGITAHLQAVEARTGEEDPAVIDAYHSLKDAVEAYEDALFDTYEEVVPFSVVEFVEEDEEDLLPEEGM